VDFYPAPFFMCLIDFLNLSSNLLMTNPLMNLLLKSPGKMCLVILCMSFHIANAQDEVFLFKKPAPVVLLTEPSVVKYGIASFYADKFKGSETYSGEIYESERFTAACNIFPMHTWVKVTNLKNNKWVIVKINDRMSKTNKRLIDLSKSAAKELAFISRGLTKVKIELIED
jgi:rare lipoprotein A